MAAAQSIQVNIGKDRGTAIIGGITVEVDSDSGVVVYTNDGVQTKAKPKPAVAVQILEDTEYQRISIGRDFNSVALYGAKVEVAPDGSATVYTDGTVKVKPVPANDFAAVSAEPQIGDVMPAGHKQAGWIYAGISKTTHEPFYVAPKDSGVFKWKQAMAFAAKDGSRVPSQEELDQIYDAREKGALKGTFNVTGSNPAGWYWSSSQNYILVAGVQRFSDGSQLYGIKYDDLSLRCVRG